MIDSPAPATAPMRKPVALSVVLVAGSGLPGIARTLRHLRAQTARDRIELIVVAESAHTLDVRALDGDAFAACRVIEVGPIRQRGDAAAKGIRAATAPIVAMIEDHSYPEPEWAEAFLRAHEGPWTVVGPAVANANPEYVASWVNYALTYGIFAPPLAAGERDLLPWHNSAYKREALAPFSDRLGALLEWEGSLQDELRADRSHAVPRAGGAHPSRERLARLVHGGAQRAARAHHRRAARGTGEVVVLATARAGGRVSALSTAPAPAHAPRDCAGCRSPTRCVHACTSASAPLSACWPRRRRGGCSTGAGNAISRMEDYELHRTKHLSRRERRDLAARERAMSNAD